MSNNQSLLLLIHFTFHFIAIENVISFPHDKIDVAEKKKRLRNLNWNELTLIKLN